jgi:hypothetical protein
MVASVLAVAGAFVSFALLQSIATGLEGGAIGQLAPKDTLGRLWVFFVLVPALLTLAGVGLPCLARTLVALARGTLARDGVISLAAIATSVGLVGAEAAMRRSGTTAFVLACLLCLWRIGPLLGRIRDTLHGPLLFAASLSVLAFAVYQQRLQGGEAPSVAVAPTLFLISFYATFVGVGTGLAGTGAAGGGEIARAAASLVWLAAYAAWIAAVQRWGTVSTYVTGVVLALLAFRMRASSARRVDESRTFL